MKSYIAIITIDKLHHPWGGGAQKMMKVIGEGAPWAKIKEHTTLIKKNL